MDSGASVVAVVLIRSEKESHIRAKANIIIVPGLPLLVSTPKRKAWEFEPG